MGGADVSARFLEFWIGRPIPSHLQVSFSQQGRGAEEREKVEEMGERWREEDGVWMTCRTHVGLTFLIIFL